VQRRAASIAILFGLAAFFVFITHYKLISLPFFWDEAGQFVSQAHDIYEGGGLIPKSTLPNSHPPGLPLVLAGVWKVAGYSIEVTRGVMLVFAAAYLVAGFLLAVELLKGARGAPVFAAVAMLALNPQVYMQGMMAQLDLPAAVATTVMLIGWVKGMEGLTLGAAVVSVCFKETSLAMAVVLAWFAWREGRKQFAVLLVVLPGLVVANWVGYVWWATGRAFGDGAYAEYNLLYPLHPVRLGYALVRRALYLGAENLHVVPLAVLVWRWKEIGFEPVWRPVAAACAGMVVLVSVAGGAVLERYLLPVLPVLYAAYAGALSTLDRRVQNVALGVTCAGMVAMLFVNPPWPYALENNLAMKDLVELQREVAGLVDARLRGSRVTTAWPLSDGLRKPYLGYVQEPVGAVRVVDDFSLERLKGMEWRKGDVLVMYDRAWNPKNGLGQVGWVKGMLEGYFRVKPEASLEEVKTQLGMTPVVGMERGGFVAEVLIQLQ
jgi:hypothetical protein